MIPISRSQTANLSPLNQNLNARSINSLTANVEGCFIGNDGYFPLIKDAHISDIPLGINP